MTAQEEITYGKKNQQETILTHALRVIPDQFKKTQEPLSALTAEKSQNSDGEPITLLEHHLRQYTRRNTSDYFIHKDLKGFLSRELDFYLKNEVLSLDEMEAAGEDRAEGWFQMMRVIKSVGSQIIDFLNQIENFQKMLWEKRKFVTETQYCITIGHIDESFYEDIAGCEAQWAEWKELFGIDEDQTDLFTLGKDKIGKRVEFLKARPTLVLDTIHFDQDFVDRLLGSFDDLKEMTDGVLIHSENWQALNLLQERYREQVKCIYIDPPYNTAATEILYKNEYKHSSWLSLIADRLSKGREFLEQSSILCVTIDDVELKDLYRLTEETFGSKSILGAVAIRINPSGRPTEKGFALTHEYAIFAAKSKDAKIYKMPRSEEQISRFKNKDEQSIFEWRNLRREGSNSDRSDGERQYYPIYAKLSEGNIRVPKMEWIESERKWKILEESDENETVIWPINESGREKNWRWSEENLRRDYSQFLARIPKYKTPQVYYKYRPNLEGYTPLTLWMDKRYSATENGTKILKDLFDTSIFSYPKSVYAVMDCLSIMGLNHNCDCVLDYFAGSGTTGHAVINLNREDGGQRKFILVEDGRLFRHCVLLPRIKKVTFTPEWKDGKPKRYGNAGRSQAQSAHSQVHASGILRGRAE